MNNNDYVEFKKERDLGAIITDTFKFLRVEWKPFFTTVFKIAIVPILLAIAGLLYYSFEASNIFNAVASDPNDISNVSSMVNGVLLSTIVMLVTSVVAYIMINLASMYYLKSYVENNGLVSYEEVANNVKKNIWPFIGLGILSFIIIMIGTFFCFFPGIYLGIVLSLASSIYVFKGKDVMETIDYSFKFIKDHWWTTFGVLFVMGLLVGILGYVFQIPALIYVFVKAIIGAVDQDPSVVQSMFSDPLYLLLNAVAYLGRFLFYAVSLVSTVLIYFDINEQKYATGTIDKIDSIGQ